MIRKLFEKLKLIKPRQPHLPQNNVSGSAFRYPMTYDQPCQIDCRVTGCKFYKGAGKCENVSPSITLNENGKFVCWSKADRQRTRLCLVRLDNKKINYETHRKILTSEMGN